jgi:UDP-glucose 6-dehydrogenase
MKVAVVGTVTAACVAARGHDVRGVDVDTVKAGEIQAGRSPAAEPGLDELVAQTVTDGTLHATTSCTEALDQADLRSLLHLARAEGAHMLLLADTLATNELVISEVVDRATACDARIVAVLGLSFKMNTDDLRESPKVELAERLMGKGFDVRIYDPVVHPARLTGANRRYVESKLPHLERLLTHEPGEALQGAGIAIVSSSDPSVLEALLMTPPRHLIDLTGRLGSEVESLPGYEGLGW